MLSSPALLPGARLRAWSAECYHRNNRFSTCCTWTLLYHSRMLSGRQTVTLISLLQALKEALSSGTAKAQWNAAAAAARVFSAAGGIVAALPKAAAELPRLASAAADVLQGSANSKARTQAAAALAAAAALPVGLMPRSALREALQRVCAAQGQGSSSAGSGGGGGSGSGSAIGSTVDAADQAWQPGISGSGYSSPSAPPGTVAAAEGPTSGGADVPTVAELRYRASLGVQLHVARAALDAALHIPASASHARAGCL
jgi:hypothetical protein